METYNGYYCSVKATQFSKNLFVVDKVRIMDSFAKSVHSFPIRKFFKIIVISKEQTFVVERLI